MKYVGFSVVPANTTDEIKAQVELVTTQTGGAGAARELCDLLLKAQNKWTEALKFYGH
jgi:3-deoxy-D-manno-octulosonate 8-phosphate phosphatase (KDO 8-P phosphatase)